MTTGKKAERNTRSYEARDPQAKQKQDMRNDINNAVNQGRMKKPRGKCPNCGRTGGRIEYDHSANKWKCSKCHARGGAVTKARKKGKKG